MVQVIARSAAGTIATDFTSDVTIALASHPAGGQLWLPTKVRAVEGIATFLDLHLNALGGAHADRDRARIRRGIQRSL